MKSKMTKVLLLVVSFVMILSYYTMARGWTEIGADWYYVDDNEDYVTNAIKSSNEQKYYLDDDGRMVRDYLLQDYNGATYYFDDNGIMVKDTWVAVEPLQIDDVIENGPTVYLFYFGANGKAFKANEGCIKKIIDGKKYLFDEKGRMLSGWINSEGEMFTTDDISEDPFLDEYVYYAGDETDGVLREGWMEYTDGSISDDYYDRLVMWFYFNPNNNKKARYDGSNGHELGDFLEKKINGETYAFDKNGVMLTGWDAVPATRYYVTYEEDRGMAGKLVKKNWIYAVPSEEINEQDNIDEIERWFYANADGGLAKGMLKKINGNEYIFDNSGILRSDLVVLDRTSKKYLYTIDTEMTDGKTFLTDRIYYDKDLNKEINSDDSLFATRGFDPKKHILAYFNNDEESDIYGAREMDKVIIHFQDDDYEYASDKKGEYEGYKKKKGKAIYHFGIKLKADPLIGYGLVLEKMARPSTVPAGASPSEVRRTMTTFRNPKYDNTVESDAYTTFTSDINEYHAYFTQDKYDEAAGGNTVDHWTPVYRMVDTKGKIYDKRSTAKKDDNDNYWILDDKGYVAKIVSVKVKKENNGWKYYSTPNGKDKDEWIRFGVYDQFGKTVTLGDQPSDESYDIYIDDAYCLNFTLLR